MQNNKSLKEVLLSFQGRIPRSIYWYWVLGYTGITIVALILDYAIGTTYDSNNSQIGCISSIVSILAIVPALAVGAKRCHDRDHSGWFLLISLIPFIGSLWLFIELGCLRGTVGPNKYGPDPLQASQSPVVSMPLQP